ncbi:nucleoside diphosphate kinase, mitochondrial isoform X2 [Pygocentrus nattereri]|uniref:nucleoside diphosphate kinase, mitochondrial isoform X2 n=1 Tax=Pygocentrus nattereri TaxID=42514 RepID=UPI0008143D0E|nr:nucleoside diphosphate kinase, mitochondrial isoform X2 [Pygocentrus nattereri]
MAAAPVCLLNRLLLPGVRPVSRVQLTWLCGRPRSHSTASGIPGVKERTLVAVKPDGVQRRLIGQIIKRLEQRGFQLVGLKMLQVSEELLAQHYASLHRKPFYPSLLRYMTSGPVVAMVWEGHNVVKSTRMLVGNTNPAEAAPGTLRGDFSVHVSRFTTGTETGAVKELDKIKMEVF